MGKMKKGLIAFTISGLLIFGAVYLSASQRWPVYPMTRTLILEKDLVMKELSAAPPPIGNYGKIYVLSSDGHLYFKDNSGSVIDLTAGGSGTFYDNGESGSAKTVDWGNSNYQKITLTAVGVDLTFTEPDNPGKYMLMIIQDGTGSRTIDWAHEINPKWPQASAPTLSTGAADVDIITFFHDGGTDYYGVANLDFS